MLALQGHLVHRDERKGNDLECLSASGALARWPSVGVLEGLIHTALMLERP